MAKAKLTSEMQLFVIQQIAMFEKPTAVQTALKDAYGVEIALPGILHYDILSPTFPNKWRATFEQMRAAFLDNTNAIPIANKAFRLKELDRLYHRNKGSRMENPVDQRATLEQAAKETGGQYTNRTEVTGKDGGPQEHNHSVNLSKLSTDELVKLKEINKKLAT